MGVPRGRGEERELPVSLFVGLRAAEGRAERRKAGQHRRGGRERERKKKGTARRRERKKNERRPRARKINHLRRASERAHARPTERTRVTPHCPRKKIPVGVEGPARSRTTTCRMINAGLIRRIVAPRCTERSRPWEVARDRGPASRGDSGERFQERGPTHLLPKDESSLLRSFVYTLVHLVFLL